MLGFDGPVCRIRPTSGKDHARAPSELATLDVIAIADAQPSGYVHDVLTSARQSGRTVTIISTRSADAVNDYLTRASLDQLTGPAIARTPENPASATNTGAISHALATLKARPDECVLIAESPAMLSAAKSSGIATIAYARTHAAREIAHPYSAATVTSLADLVLRLRARPLPN